MFRPPGARRSGEPFGPPSPIRLLILLVAVVVAIVFLLRWAGG